MKHGKNTNTYHHHQPPTHRRWSNTDSLWVPEFFWFSLSCYILFPNKFEWQCACYGHSARSICNWECVSCVYLYLSTIYPHSCLSILCRFEEASTIWDYSLLLRKSAWNCSVRSEFSGKKYETHPPPPPPPSTSVPLHDTIHSFPNKTNAFEQHSVKFQKRIYRTISVFGCKK